MKFENLELPPFCIKIHLSWVNNYIKQHYVMKLCIRTWEHIKKHQSTQF